MQDSRKSPQTSDSYTQLGEHPWRLIWLLRSVMDCCHRGVGSDNPEML